MKLLKALLEIYKDEFELNLKEGLTKTTSLGQTVDILEKTYKNKYEFYKTMSAFFIKTYSADLDNLNQLIKTAENLGWFPSWVEVDEYEGKYNSKVIKKGEVIYKLRFEAKFDKKIDRIPLTLYHLTPKQNWDKISKIGLVPKSRSKASYHPERVYLGKDMKSLKFLSNLFYQKTGIKEYTLIKIDTELIPQYFTLYSDPNFQNGYYTLNNIPPTALTKIKDINI